MDKVFRSNDSHTPIGVSRSRIFNERSTTPSSTANSNKSQQMGVVGLTQCRVLCANKRVGIGVTSHYHSK